MQEVEGKVAVITGAASGIGRAMARVFGAAGMRVALADVEAGALREARAEIAADGVEAAAFACDVSQADAVRKLAEDALSAFGRIHVVCNNAGVFCGGTTWGTSVNDYEWILRVNVWGVIHGLRTFVPILLEQNEPAHVVNTASMAGLTTGPLTAAYFMSKHAAVALSESLFHELAMRPGCPVGVSVLCPELVRTRIFEAERNRPPHLKRDAAEDLPEETKQLETTVGSFASLGVDPRVLAERTLAAIREDRFWILPPEGDPWRVAARLRNRSIDDGANPTLGGALAGEGL
ncbi:MAG TPA: SDR family NAD(P)-dependent oxidoreductase [Myxococcota bacterium]|nr:SDR family NAD(P)-dependent oxidoreductase [Myxococcota bacterium]